MQRVPFAGRAGRGGVAGRVEVGVGQTDPLRADQDGATFAGTGGAFVRQRANLRFDQPPVGAAVDAARSGRAGALRSAGVGLRAGADRAGGTYRAVQDVGAAEEAGHEHAGRALVEGTRGADLHDAAGAHHRNPVGHGERFFQVVGYEQGGLPQPAQDARQVDQELIAQRAVEAG